MLERDAPRRGTGSFDVQECGDRFGVAAGRELQSDRLFRGFRPYLEQRSREPVRVVSVARRQGELSPMFEHTRRAARVFERRARRVEAGVLEPCERCARPRELLRRLRFGIRSREKVRDALARFGEPFAVASRLGQCFELAKRGASQPLVGSFFGGLRERVEGRFVQFLASACFRQREQHDGSPLRVLA